MRCCANTNRTRPGAVGVPSLDERSNRDSPSSASRRRIAWLTAGWVRCSASAAREKLFCWATARKTSSWLISINWLSGVQSTDFSRAFVTLQSAQLKLVLYAPVIHRSRSDYHIIDSYLIIEIITL